MSQGFHNNKSTTIPGVGEDSSVRLENKPCDFSGVLSPSPDIERVLSTSPPRVGVLGSLSFSSSSAVKKLYLFL